MKSTSARAGFSILRVILLLAGVAAIVVSLANDFLLGLIGAVLLILLAAIAK